MAKAFASTADLDEKKEKFVRLADGAYCLTAEGDPNSGVVIGDDCCMVIDARATPVMARELVRHIRKVTDKPVKYVVLTHYHAVRVLGASGYKAEHVIASRPTFEMIKERGKQDWKSEVGRFPRLFRAADSVPGLTWPTIVFDRSMTLFLGRKEVRILQPGGGGHTRGDSVVWLPKEKVLFSGDLVEEGATPYCGDAQLAEWPATLDALLALKPEKLVPGRGEAMLTAAASRRAIEGTRAFVQELLAHAKKGLKAKKDLKQVYADTYRAMAPKYGRWVIFDHCM
ncbi:MAG: MBL fold metallo-hydrolase, partial [Rhodospirillales bacterium]|nr:MBL fold metallo-hydrolase [Rhodospirillales bacterium]